MERRSVKYSNPKVPEGINVGKRHPLAEFLRLLTAVVALLGVCVLVLALVVGWAAKFIPWEFELELAQRSEGKLLASLSEDGIKVKKGPEQEALQELADKISQVMDLPEGMQITVDYADHSMVNAFATLGGRLIFFRGMLEKMPDENTLAMVMAHEIAHVRQRHVIASAGRGLAVALTVYGVTGASGSAVPDSLISSVSLVSSMTFSRSQERESDAFALNALQAHYGHIGGSSTLFRLFVEQRKDDFDPPEFMSTHPAPANRVETVERAGDSDTYVRDGERTALDSRLIIKREKPHKSE